MTYVNNRISEYGLKYFQIEDRLYHCSNVFNYCAVDKNLTVWLYGNKPILKLEKDHWSSNNTSSYDNQVTHKGKPYSGDWTKSLTKLAQ